MKKMTSEDVFKKNIMELVIPADKVAHVQSINPLEHALLVLMKTGYSAIPVLDRDSRLQGVISKTLILNNIVGIERIEYEKLGERIVESAMKKNPPLLRVGDDLLSAIKLSIDHAFICIEDDKGIFQGILPRSSLLKFLNHYLRDISRSVTDQP
ncbi:CBS domain-containing protein [Pullulanibacillus pueri]|uniref:CBS domain-containing protein n=1 Tax=Pullulanibacillus pueri TaxID=1437324 RepID=A0A8J3EJ64_9BACL|nr:cyclic-di-AMP-binding protein CbpB [Pullulanibacillus pueri]MBM7680049.1 CBS domain-containing protein [Pullulanibacillus pueri]GGH74109.1 CBS domain-containing protein [Pullulanibacillus pueri]